MPILRLGGRNGLLGMDANCYVWRLMKATDSWTTTLAGRWRWRVRPGVLLPAFGERLAGGDRLLAPPVTLFKENARTQVARLAAGELVTTPVFIKVYRRQDWQRAVRDFFCGSRARRAVTRAGWLGQAGIAVVRIVAVGWHCWAWWKECAVISAEVPQARTLRAYTWTRPPVRERRQVWRRYGELLARLHQGRLSYGDPSAYNVLITPDCQLVMVDVDSLKRRWWWPSRLAVRELRHVLSRTQLGRKDELCLLKQYAQVRGWPLRKLVEQVKRYP